MIIYLMIIFYYAQRLYWYKCVRLSRLLAFECTLNHCTFISFHIT